MNDFVGVSSLVMVCSWLIFSSVYNFFMLKIYREEIATLQKAYNKLKNRLKH